MLVRDHLARAAREYPERLAVVDSAAACTWAELDRSVERAARWLTGQGVLPGARVVYAGGNDRRFLSLCYATLRIGAIFVPLHPELTAPQIGYVVENAEAAIVVSELELDTDVPVLTTDAMWAQVELTPAGPVATPDLTAGEWATAIAFLIYTSGTTGKPKGVVCPHRQVAAAAGAIQARLGYRADDVVLCRLPMSFDYGLYQALLCMVAGATLVLADKVRDKELLELVARHGVTVVPLVPSLGQMLILLQRNRPKPTAVRLFTNTGARLGRETAVELLDLFPGSVYASMYGMTECKRIAILDPAEYAAHPESVGPPIPGLTVAIVDADGRAVPTGSVGEIVVHGTTVMAGYWRTPLDEQSRYVRRDDGSLALHTGDQGRLDAEGRLYFVGRDDDMIKRRGIRVSLTEIEDAAELVPGVTAAVAVRPAAEGAPLHLAVQCSITVPELAAALAAGLDHARRPDRITRIDRVPLTPNGKPDRKAVARLLEGATPAVPTLQRISS